MMFADLPYSGIEKKKTADRWSGVLSKYRNSLLNPNPISRLDSAASPTRTTSLLKTEQIQEENESSEISEGTMSSGVRLSRDYRSSRSHKWKVDSPRFPEDRNDSRNNIPIPV